MRPIPHAPKRVRSLAAPMIWGLALLATAAQAETPASPAPRNVFTPDDVFGLAQATEPRISPDGRTVAYTRASQDIMTDGTRREIWLVDVRSGDETPLGGGESAQPRWSPDGKRLAYVAAGRNGAPQIFVKWIATGQSAALTSLPEAPGDLVWSPDGRMIAFSMFVPGAPKIVVNPVRKPAEAKWAEPLSVIDRINYRADGRGYLRAGYKHTFVLPVSGGAPRQLTRGEYDDAPGLAWMPDSQHVLVTSNHHPDRDRELFESDVFSVDIRTETAVQLTTRIGPDKQPTASPDGKWIAYIGYDEHLLGYANATLGIMRPDGSSARVLTTALDRSVENPQWASDGSAVYVDYTDHGVTKVASVGLDGRIKPVADGLVGAQLARPYSGGSFSVAADGTVVSTVGDASRPAELAISRDRKQRTITKLNAGLLDGKTLADVRHLSVSAGDGLPIDAWMLLPPGHVAGRTYPMILEIHGGPYLSYGPAWSTMNQLYAAAGYVVLYANPRGSTSYGAHFANTIQHDFPNHDYDDLMASVDAAVATGVIDANNLFVTGGSGGGLLTAWIVGKTNRFKAAVAQKPVINWTSEVLTTDFYNAMSDFWFGATPWTRQEDFWKRSPLSLVGSVKTPTAVMVGTEDFRTPTEQSEQYYAALQLQRVPTALIRIPGAGHDNIADRPSQLAAEVSAITGWFSRYRVPSQR